MNKRQVFRIRPRRPELSEVVAEYSQIPDADLFFKIIDQLRLSSDGEMSDGALRPDFIEEFDSLIARDLYRFQRARLGRNPEDAILERREHYADLWLAIVRRGQVSTVGISCRRANSLPEF